MSDILYIGVALQQNDDKTLVVISGGQEAEGSDPPTPSDLYVS